MNITSSKTTLLSIQERLKQITSQMYGVVLADAPESDIPKVAGFQEGQVKSTNVWLNLLLGLQEDVQLALNALEHKFREYKLDITFDDNPEFNPIDKAKRLFGYHEYYERFYKAEGRRIDIDKLPIWQLEELNMIARQAAKLDLDYLYFNPNGKIDTHWLEDGTIQQGFIMEIQ